MKVLFFNALKILENWNISSSLIYVYFSSLTSIEKFCLWVWCLSSVKIQDVQPFSNHLVVYEREDGLPKINIYRLPAIGEPVGRLEGGRTLDFVDPVYSLDMSESEFYSSILRFHYSSMRTPPSVYDYDMNSGVLVLKKTKMVS